MEAAEAQRNEWAESRNYWRERAVAAEQARDLARDYVASLHGAKSYEQMVSMADRLRAAEARVEALSQALQAYEQAVQEALRVAPNHWHQYRDPFELSFAIRSARSLARAAALPVPEREGG